MFSVSFTSMTVTETLMLTSIDRPQGVFTQESIIKVAQLGTDSYFGIHLSPHPLTWGEQRRGEAWPGQRVYGIWISEMFHTLRKQCAECLLHYHNWERLLRGHGWGGGDVSVCWAPPPPHPPFPKSRFDKLCE